ncbi:hypothetical protein [Nocardiopsis ganjiahuensis]|uniref:hypothetical protein n=1 Tax=Nocardiopsis ganjiahuensis TaxID=239984 RepID=UPI0004781B48|nr:hypothetical protein [Nocardiopsis ganjiahuensis]
MADIPSTGHVGEAGAQRFALRGDGVGGRSAAFVAFAKEEARAGRKVVALYPAWQASDAERAVNFARGALRTDHIAGIGVDLSPLALSLIADQLAYLAPYLPPGMVAALSDELPKHLLAGAWLRTVSGLSTLPTSLRQHMGSYAPSVSFLAYCAPNAQVGRLRPSEVADALPFRPVQPVQLLCSTPDPSITKVFDENLPRAIQPVATRTLPAQPLGATYWGTGKYVEFVALSAHPQALAYAAGSIRAAACSWCGEPMSAKPCPFCAGNSTGSLTRAHHTAAAPPGGGPPPGPRPQAPRSPAPQPQAPRPQATGPQAPHSPAAQPQAPRPQATAPEAPRSPAPRPQATGPQIPEPQSSGPPSPNGNPAFHGAPGPGNRPPSPGPGHRPPGPSDRPEGPAFQDRAPQPESPRTYSR